MRHEGAMMRRCRWLALLPMALLASEATAQNLNWYDISFKKFQSYLWAPRVTKQAASSSKYAIAQASIDRYLASRGFKPAPNGDFAVGFALGDSEGDYDGSFVDGQSAVGSLSIDIYDTTTKRIIWHAQISAPIAGTPSQAQLDEAVETLLRRFPPSHGCSHSAPDTIIFPCPRQE